MGRSGEGGHGWTLAGAAFVMPMAGLNRKHVLAPDYQSAWKKKAGADGTRALALRRAIGGRAMQAPAVCGRRRRPRVTCETQRASSGRTGGGFDGE
jgi:hypothetical protein